MYDIGWCVIEVRIAQILAERGKSRYWLAKQAGISQPTISKLFKQETSGIDFATLERICEVLECETGDVIAYVPNKTNAHNEGASPSA
jgi:putative transcriptional regulator